MVVSKKSICWDFNDVLYRVVSPRLNTKKTLVSEVMTKNFSSIDVSLTLQETLQIMNKNRVRHLPVFQNTRLLGMVSIGDVTRKLLEINQNEANSLRDYLFTSYSG